MFDGIKQVVLLRRIARASERQAAAMETLARLAADWWAAKYPAKLGKGAEVDFGLATDDEIVEAYERRLERESLGNYDQEEAKRP
jgi:hypothetical protein